MSKKLKVALSILIITILVIATVKQSIRLHNSINGVQFPTQQSRQLSKSGIYNWMTVGELAKKFGTKEEKVFELLGITPQPEDYKLSILALRKKYNITSEEMLKGLKNVINYSHQNGGKHE
ncbi:hypothetical protein [Desulfosporosinus fructosivorans]